ncbi:hypothetical protein D5F01_LYC24235 [Larimichthys crocea]|uniref:Pyrin domain-containing protein n=1 Tax=Larimichthys crocea TaxID=215358 RepID=A0A6G0HEW9_LARCR|nr:hypothetical protein D5F01_LYC24235 [Larimichthys crocea]
MVNFFRENSEHMKPFLDKAADNPELRNIIRKLQRNDEAYYPEFVVEAIQRYYASEFYLVMEDILTDIVPDFSSEAICQSAEQYYKRCLDNIKVDPRLYKYVFEDLTSDEFKRAKMLLSQKVLTTSQRKLPKGRMEHTSRLELAKMIFTYHHPNEAFYFATVLIMLGRAGFELGP